MGIKQISVKGLFGIFDHVIPLNTEERITIIHGLNGFGKTSILRILNGIFNDNYLVILNIPFKSFNIYFENKTSFEVTKNRGDLHIQDINIIAEKLIFNLCDFKSKTMSFSPLQEGKIKLSNNSKYEELFKIVETKWSEQIKNHLSKVTIKDYINKLNSKKLNNTIEPDWFKEIKKDISIKLIESQRLIDFNYDDFPSVVPTVSTYSDEIAKLMQDKFAEYGKISQSLDRTFPIRAVKQQHSNNLTDKELIEELNKLEKTRSRLIELGLLDRGENQDFDNQPQNIDESTKNILSVYVEDTKSKLSIFDTIANKIELLKNIINRKFAYSYKKLNFSKEQGFIFTTCYPQSLEDYSKTLSPQDLSSGEQHELVLLYELLFKVEPNSLVLIDEPELSLHVSWQSQFIEDLKEITKLADLDILMATHSPDIIQDNWDNLTVELKAPEK